MPEYTDALGINISLPSLPQRIISLVPSQTELLHYLGLESEVVGITKFCVHPKEWHEQKTRVGGTKQLHLSRIRELQPDLVIANQEENTKAHIDEIRSFCPVYTTRVCHLEDALQMIQAIGDIVGKKKDASILANGIRRRFSRIPRRLPALRVAYLIWKDPYMTVGGDTFIHDMLQQCGLVNVFANEKRYPIINLSQLHESGCEVVMLSSEPYPFQEKDLEEIHAAFRNKGSNQLSVVLVNGEFFSWYGSRMLRAASSFAELVSVLHNNKP